MLGVPRSIFIVIPRIEVRVNEAVVLLLLDLSDDLSLMADTFVFEKSLEVISDI
jgi:hypothetical protein